jgi:hypothetical protein
MTKGRKPPTDTIFVTGIFGARTRQPLVQMTIPKIKDPITLEPADARLVGLSLIEAAEAAATDAFLMRLLHRHGFTERELAQILHLFRQHREQDRATRGEPDRRIGLARLMEAERAATDRFLRQFLGTDVGLETETVEAFIDDLHAERDGPPPATAA